MLIPRKPRILPLVLLVSMTCFLMGAGLFAVSPVIENMLKEAARGKISAIASISILLGFIGLLFYFRLVLRKWLILPYVKLLLVYVLASSSLHLYFILYESRTDYRWILGSICLPLIYISLTGTVRTSKALTRILWLLVCITLMIVVMLTFTDSRGNFPSLEGVLRTRYRVYLIRNEYGPVTLANLASTLFLLAWGMLLVSPSKTWSNKILGLVAITLSSIGLIASGGRTAWIATFLGLLALMFLTKRLSALGIMQLLLLLLFVVSLSYLPILSGNVQLGERLKSLGSVSLLLSGDMSLSTRIALWHSSMELSIANPLGLGFDAFQNKYGLTTHNEYFNILISTGVIGFVLYSAFWLKNMISIFKIGLRHKPSEYSKIVIIVIPILIQIAMISLTEAWSSSNVVASLLFWTTLSVGAIAAHQQKQIEKRRNHWREE